jgi:hypothetical protein
VACEVAHVHMDVVLREPLEEELQEMREWVNSRVV